VPGGGSGGVGTLQEVTDLGNSTTNDIAFTATAGILLDNGARLRKGTTNAGLGGNNGIAQRCSIDYELKWEAGRLYYMEQDGFTIRDVTHNFNVVPQPTDDSTKGFVANSRWSLDDGTIYLCSDATIGAAVWSVVSTGGVTSVTATSPLSSSGGTTPDISIQPANSVDDGYLTSADWNTFDGKFDVPTGTSSDYLDGTGAPTAFPTIPTLTSELTNDSGFITIGDVPTQVNADWNATSGFAEILNKPTLNNGTVTSVDLTMPAAFSVTGNPVTTSGTLAVSAAGVATQYIRGDGQLANFPTSSGGGASVSYYFNGSVAQGTFGGVAMQEINKVPVIGAGTDFQRTNAQGNGYIASFITDANDPNQLAIPGGNWNFENYFSASSSGGNPSFYIELYKWDGATLTLIASNSTNPENITGGTTIDVYLTALAVPQTTLAATDRLAVRIFVTTSGRTITMHTEDNHLSQIITTFSTGLTALNGLTAQTQLLAVGTSGTDFAISSASSTHTFNLPTASAVNRGALSSANWSTFNGKQDALVSGTNIKTINSTSLLGSGNISIAAPVIYKSTTDTAGYSSAANTAVYTQLIAANTFAVGDIIRVTYRTRKTGAANAQTIRIYMNATADLSGTPILVGAFIISVAGGLYNQMQRHLVIKNSTTNTEVIATSATSSPSDTINLTTAVSTLAINWTSNQYFVFAIQSGGATDVNYGSMYLIEKL
jgi:hypothetical protein